MHFPDGYEAIVYRKDGWYVRPKNPSDIKKSMVSLGEIKLWTELSINKILTGGFHEAGYIL